ncbi:MAG: hypothetical protein NC037_01455 [Bacteroides sp.]|nr:hypothetical protein [Bacillota bacterium]MCM1394140.1 hypothetical protein [[Eubacterium] siraeum]MCM1455182.1 hypothetical protein [Bacteroides sp.]
MAVIGVYDSGIGGLTSVAEILLRFEGNDIYYLADNLNHPFGTKSESELKEIVASGIKKVRAHSDVAVVACNTASSISDDKEIIRLLPPVDLFRAEANDTLLMATDRTLSAILYLSGYRIVHTPELATLVEVQANLNHLKGNLNMDELAPYFNAHLAPFKGVKRVILGCSHYLYCKKQITDVIGDAELVSGNDRLLCELSSVVTKRPDFPSEITFDFTAQNESKKYDNVLRLLLNANTIDAEK